MSHVIKLSIPDELAGRIEEQRGDRTVQEFTLAALRSAVYGSPPEAGLLAEIERLHQTLRAFGINIVYHARMVHSDRTTSNRSLGHCRSA